MSIVSLQDVHLSYGPQVVLDGLHWEIQRGEKVGLVGANGSGKTSIFRVILGELTPQIGLVTRRRGLQIAYLPQEPDLDSTNRVLDEVASTFEDLQRLEQRVADVAQELADHHETDRADELMAEYDELCHRLEAAGGYRYETTVKEVLGGLGFGPGEYDLPVSALSGGQKCRVALAKLLLQEADLLLLDEPTNHLDIEATRFLEDYLASYHGAAVIVSHDRYLLDRVVEKTADLDARRVTVYGCAYSDFAEAKHSRQLAAEREYEKQAEWLRHQKEYAERVKADKSRSKQARGRLRHVERMEKQGQVLARPSHARRRMAIDFSPSGRAGEMVLRCDKLGKAYGDLVLFDEFELDIYRGEKIGIIGPNGVGKTTLLKMAMRTVQPDRGSIRLYENLDVGYYDQEHTGLNPTHTVLDEIAPSRRGPDEGAIRSFLARFLFHGDDVFKRVGDLSGGEQSRVVLAKLVYACPQVLILDEPTNHLDIPAREALEEALIAYKGAILLVSHDRYFLDRVVNKLLVLKGAGDYEMVPGNWSSYERLLEQRDAARREQAEREKLARRQAARKRQKARAAASAKTRSSDEPAHTAWSVDRLEAEIVDREDRLARIESRFADPDLYREPEEARRIQSEVDELRQQLAELNREWERRAEDDS